MMGFCPYIKGSLKESECHHDGYCSECPHNIKDDTISRRAAIDAANDWLLDCLKVEKQDRSCGLIRRLEDLPSAQPEEVIPHRNYKYLSDYWCECGWHLGKKGEVKYCSDCGRKVNWEWMI